MKVLWCHSGSYKACKSKHCVDKPQCIFTVVFALIGLIIYGVERESPHWSYAMTVIGMIVTLAAGIVAVVQMRQSGVPCC